MSTKMSTTLMLSLTFNPRSFGYLQCKLSCIHRKEIFTVFITAITAIHCTRATAQCSAPLNGDTWLLQKAET